MKAEALHPFREEMGRYGEVRRDIGHVPMEGSVKAGKLWQARIQLHRFAD